MRLPRSQKARAQQTDAEQRRDDLFNRRWPAASLELAAAERAAETARRALAKPHVEALKRQRVAIGARMDKRLAEVAADYELYQRLGVEIQSYDPAPDGGMMARHESFVGLQRISAALPACLKTLPASHPEKYIPLAVAEAQFWNLPPEPSEKAA
jgi:hypothetical protein